VTVAPIEGWHEFYLLAGTAAVTLVGLLFVALSFNLDALIHETKAHVLAHARSTLLTFSYVLVISLGALVPGQNTRMLGVMLAATSLVIGTLHVISLRARPRPAPTTFDRSMRRRGRVALIGYAIVLLTGALMVWTHEPGVMFNMIGAICLLLGNAMGVAWDLLVEVGKLKAEMPKPSAHS